MERLKGNPRKIFKIIYKRYNINNLINSDELSKLFPNNIQLEQDLTYLYELKLIDIDSGYHYHLTAIGRQYFKFEASYLLEIAFKSILCPIIVSIITTVITMWLSNLQ